MAGGSAEPPIGADPMTQSPAEILIEACPEPQRAIMRRLRRLLLEAAPRIQESVKWGKPAYGWNTRTVASLVPHRLHVNLQLFEGASLPDPHGILEGTGKGMRHVKCRSLEDAEREEVRALVREAVRR